jgi:small-conductance mechanosensitive channel
LLSILLLALATAGTLSPKPAWAGPNDGLPRLDVPLDRDTPRRAFDGFLQSAHAGDWNRAAHYLDLKAIPRANQAKDGPALARELAYVLERKVIVDVSKLSDAPEGGPLALANGAPPVTAAAAAANGTEIAATIQLDDEAIAISLARVRFDDGVQRWVISRTTVAMVPELWSAYGPTDWQERLPPSLQRLKLFGVAAWQWIGLGLSCVGAYALGFVFAALVLGLLRRLARRTTTKWDDEMVEAARGPTRLVVAVIALRFFMETLRFTAAVDVVGQRLSFSVLVVGLAWLVMRGMSLGAAWIESRLPDGDAGDHRTRGLRTQLEVLSRVFSVIAVLIAAAVILMQFDFVRSVGVSLLASAGIAGVVVGLAAQKSLSGLIAGIQLSITQPMRIGDSVVIEGEFGTIEEINLTYVVVKIWDERRLIVPIGRFLDQPFQNWTKVGGQIHGSVMLYVDYATPIEAIRAETLRLCKETDAWDGRTATVQVTDLSDRAATVRVLVSARNGDDAFRLRCHLRERLLAFLAALDGGRYLVRSRTEEVSGGAAGGADARSM